MPQPFFSIGVPTYNRHDLLKQTLESILSQEFTDFEVLVGNDYTAEALTGEMLGIADPRVRIVNHPRNLREVGNMNALREMATGRYFTWLFDDDLYAPGFLQAAHDTLAETGFPPALFPSYRVIDETGNPLEPVQDTGTVTLLDGSQFLDAYFSSRLKLNSTCGIFDRSVMSRTIGGVEEICASAIGLYCEYLLLVRCGLLDRIVHLDTPFVTFRAHTGSWGEQNTELEKYREGGIKLVLRCAEVLRRIDSGSRYHRNLAGICRIHLVTFATKSARYELAGGNSGRLAAGRAVARFAGELAKILRACASQGSLTHCSLRFVPIGIYCLRLILGKFRIYRRSRHSGQEP